jgi:hypothetical protein
VIKLTDILNEIKCWNGYKPGTPKTKISSKTGERVNNCIPIKEQSEEYPPYMYSPVGFSCKVCKYVSFNKDEDRWICSNSNYQEYMGTHYLVDSNGEPIKDPSKWCSNWFLPKK